MGHSGRGCGVGKIGEGTCGRPSSAWDGEMYERHVNNEKIKYQVVLVLGGGHGKVMLRNCFSLPARD